MTRALAYYLALTLVIFMVLLAIVALGVWLASLGTAGIIIIGVLFLASATIARWLMDA